MRWQKRGDFGMTPSQLHILREELAPGMNEVGRLLIVVGALAIVAGVVVLLLGRMNFPLGRLPGDIVYRGKNTSIYFPLATSVLVSVVLTIVLWAIGRWRR